MIFSTLLRPPRAQSGEETRGAVRPERRTLSVTRQRARRYRIAVSSGVILSVLIHILLIRVSPLFIRYMEPGDLYRPPQPVRVEATAMQAIEIRITEAPPVEPERTPEPEPEQPEPGELEGETESSLSAAERLRPRVGDWRLWLVHPLARRTDLTPAERAADLEARLQAILEAYDDSMAAELARQAEAMDWTVGEEGNKWGLSPEGLHLGPLTVPLPFYIGPGRESEDMLRDYGEIQRQAGEGAIRDAQDERIMAIRERKQREQEAAEKKAQKDTTSSG